MFKNAESLNYAKLKDNPKLQKHHTGIRLKLASSNVLKFSLWQKLDFIEEKKITLIDQIA